MAAFDAFDAFGFRFEILYHPIILNLPDFAERFNADKETGSFLQLVLGQELSFYIKIHKSQYLLKLITNLFNRIRFF